MRLINRSLKRQKKCKTLNQFTHNKHNLFVYRRDQSFSLIFYGFFSLLSLSRMFLCLCLCYSYCFHFYLFIIVVYLFFLSHFVRCTQIKVLAICFEAYLRVFPCIQFVASTHVIRENDLVYTKIYYDIFHNLTDF